MNTPLPAVLRLRVLLLLVGVLAGAGCASTPRKPNDEIRWPLPPEIARVKFVRAIRTGDDLHTSAWRSFWRSLVQDKGAGVVDMPTGLALSVDETKLYVVSPASGSIPILALDLARGEVKRFADSRESRPRSAFGVAVDGEDNVWVSDSGVGAVVAFTPDGRLVRKITEKLERPTGVAIDRRRKLLYVVSGVTRESTHHRVEVFSLDGAHVRTIGTRGTQGGEFNFPGHVAVAPNGNLLVSDMLNFRIQEFDPSGALVGMFGAAGRGPGMFDKAKGIAFDSFGNLYVVDAEQAIVQIFNARRQVLMGFGGRLDKLGYLIVPTAIVINSKNTIYVADYSNRAVNEYQLINTTAADSQPDEKPAQSVPPREGAPAPAPPPLDAGAPAKVPSPTPGGQKPQGG